jgi:hypothetical protein
MKGKINGEVWKVRGGWERLGEVDRGGNNLL